MPKEITNMDNNATSTVRTNSPIREEFLAVPQVSFIIIFIVFTSGVHLVRQRNTRSEEQFSPKQRNLSFLLAILCWSRIISQDENECVETNNGRE